MFASASGETDVQLERARLRKERGQPPGKRSDPLGDQISWEQLLDRAIGSNSVWIVARDSDYTVTIEDTLRLRPTLQRELSAVRGVKSIHCYQYLATFFEAFSKVKLAEPAGLPPKKSVEIAAQELPVDGVFEPTTWGLDQA